MRKMDIDLLNIIENEQNKITEFYQQATDLSHPNFFFAKETYHLSHDLIFCRELDCFLMLENTMLGKGSAGQVVPVFALLQNKKNTWVIEKNADYVIKIISDYRLDCDNEVILSKRISYLSMYLPVEKNLKRYFIMRRVSGNLLSGYIENAAFEKMSSLTKINLSIALCQQLKEKIHQLAILHLDIKPSNILISEKKKYDGTFYLSPRIIDFGISVPYAMRSSLTEPRGTPGYFAKSMFFSQFDFFSDVSELSVVMAQIFGHTLSKEEKIENKRGLFCCRKFNLHFNSDELSIEQQSLLSNIIHNMVNDDAKDIPSLQDVMILLQWIKLQLILPSVAEEFRPSVIRANDIALDIRPVLRKRTIDPWQMKNIFFQALEMIEDNPNAITEFIAVLNIKSLLQCRTKQEVIQTFDAIYNAYDTETIYRLSAVQSIINDLMKLDVSSEWNAFLESQQNKNKTMLASLKLFPAKLDNIKKAEKILEHIKDQPLVQMSDGMLEALPKIIHIKQRLMMLSRSFSDESLRGKLVSAMQLYIDDTLTKESVLRHDRAASAHRLQDMRDILNLVQSDLDDEVLTQRIKQHFTSKAFHVGFFGRWGSQLRRAVLAAMKSPQEAIFVTRA